MKVVKLKKDIYRKAEKLSKTHGIKVDATDIWDVLERLKKTDIHLDYTRDELIEDLK